jgi:hypothetical protein
MSSVIVGSSNQVGVSNPTLSRIIRPRLVKRDLVALGTLSPRPIRSSLSSGPVYDVQ